VLDFNFIKRMNTAIFKQLVFGILILGSLVGCRKLEWDKPPIQTIPEGSAITIQQLRAMYTGERVRFTEDKSVFAVVTMDEESGNIFRNVFIQDHTGAINVRLLAAGGLYQGDSIRINLRNTSLNQFNGMMQLDSVSVDFNIVKQATLVHVEPQNVTVDQISPALQGQLVRVVDAEFVDSDLGRTYADAQNQRTENRTLRDCSGNTVLVRTSGFANFAGQQVASGKGSLVGVVSQFNNDIQIFIRSVAEVDMNEERCGAGPCDYSTPAVAELSDDFESAQNNVDYQSINWINVAKEGSRLWRGREFGGNRYVRATSFGSFDPVNETWLITRPIEYNGQKYLRFRTAKNSGNDPFHDALSVWVSTDFDGCDIDEATWVEVTGYAKPDGSTANNAWVNSGDINLSPFISGASTFHVAFKYRSAVSQGETTGFDLDDVHITNTPGGSGGGGGDPTGPTVILEQDFEALTAGSGANEVAVNIPGWVNANVSTAGTRLWHTRSFSNNKFAEFTSNFSATGVSDEVWLITESMDLSSFSEVTLTFDTQIRFWTGPQLAVFVSENFDGTAAGISSATWTQLSPTLPEGSGQTDTFIASGNLDLSDYTSNNVRVAYRYIGTQGSQTTTYRVDNILVVGE
jgi:hypothetical protein